MGAIQRVLSRVSAALPLGATVDAGAERHEAGEYLDAIRIWRRAATSGSAESAFRIGQMYAKGEGVVRSFPDAAAWYRRAAEAGHTEAKYQLGWMLLDGVAAPVGPNTPEAWQREAADNGETPAVARLLFPAGLAVERDPAQAVRWISAAATAGHADAQARMGELCRHGRGCPRDLDAARDWYGKAAAQGHKREK